MARRPGILDRGGSVWPEPGAGRPASPTWPRQYQVLPCSGTAQWHELALVPQGWGQGYAAQWSSPRVWCWPQGRGEAQATAVSKYWPGFALSGECYNTNLWDTDIMHYWRALWRVHVTSSVSGRMSTTAREEPNAHQELCDSNGTFTWIFEPAPKYVQVELIFYTYRISVENLEPVHIKAEMRPLEAFDG